LFVCLFLRKAFSSKKSHLFVDGTAIVVSHNSVTDPETDKSGPDIRKTDPSEKIIIFKSGIRIRKICQNPGRIRLYRLS
jgi:hypothetical protein